MTSTSTRPVDNVVITTKGLQDRNIHIKDGTTVENKGKLIPSVDILEKAIFNPKFLVVYTTRITEIWQQIVSHVYGGFNNTFPPRCNCTGLFLLLKTLHLCTKKLFSYEMLVFCLLFNACLLHYIYVLTK